MKKEFPANKFNLKTIICLVLLLAGFQLRIIAQNIDFTAPEGCPNNPVALADQVVGQPGGIPAITATNPPGGAPFTMSIPTIDAVVPVAFNICSSCVSPFIIGGLTFTTSGSQVTISGTPDATLIGYTLNITLTATPSAGSPCSRVYSLKITRKPIDLVMVLDKSGSMTLPVSVGGSRWDLLKQGVAQFMANYQPNLLAGGGANGDQMGIRMFSNSDAAPVNPPFNVNNFIPVTPGTATAGILDGDNPRNTTGLGQGLLTAHNFLYPGGVDNGHKKAMLLFTDGEQNVSPNVIAAAGSNPTVSGTDLTHGDQVKIHTIGLGIAGAATQTLYNIAHESGGITNIPGPAASPDLNINQYLLDASDELFTGSSPQKVDVRRSNFKQVGTSFGAQETFTVNKNIDKIFVNFMTAGRNEARVAGIEKDGKAIYLYDSSVVKFKSGSGWQTFIINVAALIKRDPAFKSEGNWRVIVVAGTQSSASYILSLTVDDHSSTMTGRTTQTKELIVGDKLPLSIELTKRGIPITNATALAVIAKDGIDLGNALARAKIDLAVDTSADANNIAMQKLAELLKDSNFVKQLLDSSNTVSLTYDAAQKKYVGEFNELDVSGMYQVAYIISANDTALGEIRRYAEESVYIRFPKINLDSSNVVLTTLPGGATTLTLRPIAVNGNYVGPGWGNSIVIEGTDSKIASVKDNGDGSYVLTITGSLSENVKVSIGGAEIYSGPLEDIGKGGGNTSGEDVGIWKQWWFWLILIAIILIIWLAVRKKNTP